MNSRFRAQTMLPCPLSPHPIHYSNNVTHKLRFPHFLLLLKKEIPD